MPAHANRPGAARALLCALGLLASSLLTRGALAQDAAFAEGFIFGARFLDCPVPNEPEERYTVVLHGSVADLAYDAGRGYGYERIDPGNNSRGGYAVFGPFDDSPNPRSQFPDRCPDEIYDSFIGAKDFSSPCVGALNPPCLPLEGIVFRVDVPNGAYRFVAAVGSADNPHAHRIVVEDGGAGPPSNLGANHVVLVDNYDQGVHGAGVFARVGFDSYFPPEIPGAGFVDMDELGLETAGPPESPILEVTQGYLRVHQLKGVSNGADPNGGDLVVLELWRVDGGGSERFRAIERGERWEYRPGTSEPPSDWIEPSFDSSSWSEGNAPFGFGEAGVATDLSLGNPPMQGNFTSVYLRKTFELSDPTLVGELVARVRYDDGFVLYGNGLELLRVNAPGVEGSPLPATATAIGGHEADAFETFELPNPIDWLRAGENTIAVQILNSAIGSTDLFFDAEIYDPFGPDLTAPSIATITPLPGATLRRLEEVRVSFDEDVQGVDAADVLINGSPATSVSGDGAGPWVFTFPSPAPGVVEIDWSASAGITDLANPPNAFSGEPWTYTLDPDAPAAEVVIHEILAVKNGGPRDEDGEESDYIELLNRGDAPVDLGGWSLTQSPDEPGEWVFPSVLIAPGEHLVVYASGKDRRTPGSPLHTSFKLSAGGEYLGLYDADAPPRLVSELAPRFPPQRAGVSYGTDANGKQVWFATPTPGAPNSTGTTFSGFVLEPVAKPGRGFYEEPVLVTLSSATPDATIRYTLDGSEPTPTSGLVYSGPFEASGAPQRGVVTVRAMASKAGALPSEVVTFTYVFPEHVMTQPPNPPGFPTSWNGQPADYAMDPRIVNDPGHRDLVREGLTSIPTLSIVTDVDNLFHPQQGIYTNPSREGIAWERPVSAELIYPDGRSTQINCGLRVQGGSSVSGWKVIKVSLRLLFKGDYGPTKLRWPLFPDSSVEEFDTIVLDAHMNQTWQHPDRGQRVRAQYCRDLFMSDLQNATGGYAPNDIFANVYLNGLYWGIFDLHERADHSFAAQRFGGDKSEYDALRHTGSEVVEGSATAWAQMITVARRNLAEPANFLALGEWVDLPGLADYMLVNLWGGNDDWAHHNWYATRRRTPGGLWRFHSWDAEHVLKSLTINRTSINNPNSPTEIYTRLRASEEFRLLFADRAHRHFSPGGPFYVNASRPAWDPERPEDNIPASIWMRRIREIDSAIACEAARWGDTRQPNDPHTRNRDWLTELNALLTSYFPQRSRIVLDQLRGAGLYPNTPAPVLSPHGGRITIGTTVEMEAPGGGEIWYTIDGTDPRRFGSGDVAPNAREYNAPIELSDATVVRARVLREGEWSALAEAVYTLADPAGSVVISEIHYHPSGDPESEFIEIANVGDLAVSLGGAAFIEGIQYVFPPQLVLGPGEAIVLAANEARFAAEYPGVQALGSYLGRLDNAGERITFVDRNGETIEDLEWRDEDVWPIGADGLGWSLTRALPPATGSDPESWVASSVIGGTPGELDRGPFPPRVVVSEVLARSSPPLEDAIELANLTSRSVDVSGWHLSDDRSSLGSLGKFRIPDGTILPPSGFVVLYRSQFGSGPGGFTLDDRGGAVWLSSASPTGELTGHVSEGRWSAQSTGISFGRIATPTQVTFAALGERTFGVDVPATVEEFRQGTGRPNSAPLFGPVVLHEIHYHPLPDREEFIELHNPTGAPIALHDGALARGYRIQGIFAEDGVSPFEMPPGTVIPARGFLIVTNVAPELFRTLHAVPPSVPIVGPFTGGLSNSGERLVLERPDEELGALDWIVVDDVRYSDRAPWPRAADGDGPSLERFLATAWGGEAANWGASTRTDGTPGAPNSISDPGGNLFPEARITASPRSGAAPLEVHFDATRSFDLDGEITSYAWDFGDGATGVGLAISHTYTEPGTYQVTLTVEDDDGATDSATELVVVEEMLDGLRRQGDMNADGSVDISDPIGMLQLLFTGGFPLPCEGDFGSPGNVAILDANGDARVDLSDSIHILVWLFQGGAAPVLGETCVPIAGCSDACRE